MKITMKHKSEIKIGDTIMHNGELRTICKRAFSHDEFMGLLIFGDSYRLGYQLVEVVDLKGEAQ